MTVKIHLKTSPGRFVLRLSERIKSQLPKPKIIASQKMLVASCKFRLMSDDAKLVPFFSWRKQFL